jgi:hypothetical protein
MHARNNNNNNNNNKNTKTRIDATREQSRRRRLAAVRVFGGANKTLATSSMPMLTRLRCPPLMPRVSSLPMALWRML